VKKAMGEIGWKKAFKFFMTTWAMVFYRLMIFPQLRTCYLRCLGVHIGKNVIIHPTRFFNAYRMGFSGLHVGNNCFIGDGCLIDLADEIHMADHVTLAERVTVLTHFNVGYEDHPLQKDFPPRSEPVRFGEGCFVGAGAIIQAGINIGEQALIAAGSVVTKDVEPRTLVGGVPAKLIRPLDSEEA
jgi:acetyltransferase-like isoleucine patch superfamily enzyme